MESKADKEMSLDLATTIFDVYRKYGNQDYLGEAVTQTEHASQAALLAQQEGAPVQVILGAFLHDIGHLIGQEHNMERMVTGDTILGVKDHDIMGETFLNDLGVPSEVTCLARGHVDAKRYLTYKEKDYYESLSDASKMTLEHQGGPMSADEAMAFESHPNFKTILKFRTWEEQAKILGKETPSLEFYEQMLREYMSSLTSK